MPPRPWAYVEAKRLVCPAGHAIGDGIRFMDAGIVRCDARAASGGLCGRWTFVYAIRERGSIAVALRVDDIAAIEQMSTPAEVLDYLRIFRAS